MQRDARTPASHRADVDGLQRVMLDAIRDVILEVALVDVRKFRRC